MVRGRCGWGGSLGAQPSSAPTPITQTSKPRPPGAERLVWASVTARPAENRTSCRKAVRVHSQHRCRGGSHQILGGHNAFIPSKRTLSCIPQPRPQWARGKHRGPSDGPPCRAQPCCSDSRGQKEPDPPGTVPEGEPCMRISVRGCTRSCADGIGEEHAWGRAGGLHSRCPFRQSPSKCRAHSPGLGTPGTAVQ